MAAHDWQWWMGKYMSTLPGTLSFAYTVAVRGLNKPKQHSFVAALRTVIYLDNKCVLCLLFMFNVFHQDNHCIPNSNVRWIFTAESNYRTTTDTSSYKSIHVELYLYSHYSVLHIVLHSIYNINSQSCYIYYILGTRYSSAVCMESVHSILNKPSFLCFYAVTSYIMHCLYIHVATIFGDTLRNSKSNERRRPTFLATL